MVQHFLRHEAAFEEILVLVDSCRFAMYYPPYDAQDTSGLQGVSATVRSRLDTLLAEIGSERIFFLGKELRRQLTASSGWNGSEPAYSRLTISHYSHGYSVGGTNKDFVYDPGVSKAAHVTGEIDLNDIYRQNFCDTTLYNRSKDSGILHCLTITDGF